jgi:hypothetical protein
MFVPSYAFIANAIGIADVPQHGNISINVQTLRLLLQFVAMAADFDQATYLKENPDVASAYEAGQINDLHKHYIERGFFESRKAAEIHFDEKWYLETYPDVAASVHEQVIPSALSHFLARGEVEMRSPDPKSLPWMQAWAEALARPVHDE